MCYLPQDQGRLYTSHQIRNIVIEELLIDSIRQITAFARDREDDFIELVSAKSKTATERSLRDSKRELDRADKRILKLDSIIQRLYEDNIEGKISDERFKKMTDSYEAEQKGLESRIAELKVYISAEKDNTQNTAQFLKLVRKHTDIHELTAEIIREFVEKIYVHNKEIVNGKRV